MSQLIMSQFINNKYLFLFNYGTFIILMLFLCTHCDNKNLIQTKHIQLKHV